MVDIGQPDRAASPPGTTRRGGLLSSGCPRSRLSQGVDDGHDRPDHQPARGRRRRIVFNNPEKRNAVSLAMWQSAERALDEFGGDDGVGVVVLSGAGDKAFVSGADISKFESERAGAEAVAHYNASTARFYQKLTAFPRPTVAEITGSCVGGGVALAVCCDLRICGQSSRFGIPAASSALAMASAA